MRTSAEFSITYGNQSGTYFTEWRMDLLREFLHVVVYAYGDEQLVKLENIAMWYDDVQDFHYLAFVASGKRFEIRFYKVFSLCVDDVQNWSGCPRSEMSALASHIRGIIRGTEQ